MKSLKNMTFKFGDGHASERMIEVIRKIVVNQDLKRKVLTFPAA
jgi:UDP-N-acetylglucosamine 2-epimerase